MSLHFIIILLVHDRNGERQRASPYSFNLWNENFNNHLFFDQPDRPTVPYPTLPYPTYPPYPTLPYSNL